MSTWRNPIKAASLFRLGSSSWALIFEFLVAFTPHFRISIDCERGIFETQFAWIPRLPVGSRLNVCVWARRFAASRARSESRRVRIR